jgi:hypothetical protein
MAEKEELQLRVTMVDEASAGLYKLRTGFQQLTTGPAAASVEKFKQSQIDLSKTIKEATQAMIGGQQAMLGYVGKWGLFGFAAAKGIELLIQFTGRLQNTARLFEDLGRSFGSVHDAIRQFQAGGVAVDKAREASSILTSHSPTTRSVPG